jgi:hypothetical protein
VRTETDQFEISVPRDRAATFEPQLVRKRQRRLEGLAGTQDGADATLTLRVLLTNPLAAVPAKAGIRPQWEVGSLPRE